MIVKTTTTLGQRVYTSSTAKIVENVLEFEKAIRKWSRVLVVAMQQGNETSCKRERYSVKSWDETLGQRVATSSTAKVVENVLELEKAIRKRVLPNPKT